MPRSIGRPGREYGGDPLGAEGPGCGRQAWVWEQVSQSLWARALRCLGIHRHRTLEKAEQAMRMASSVLEMGPGLGERWPSRVKTSPRLSVRTSTRPA